MRKVLVMEKVANNKMKVVDAAIELGLSKRQILRLKKGFCLNGPESCVHKNKGKTPKHAVPNAIKEKVINVFLNWKSEIDIGLNASHLSDILLRDHGIKISRQSTWRILKENGLQIRTRRLRKYRKRRERREQMGDILYLDGSPHRWFGEAYPKSTLILCIDDATSSALWGIFVDEENRNACFEVAYEVFTRFGIPMNFWLDRASQFITTRGEGRVNLQRELPTQWQNAMYNLGVRNIFAHSPQARGRGERANSTFQDRLCAELQYRNINDYTRANFFLNEIFIRDYNKKFAVEPQNSESLWRKPPVGLDLRHVLCARTDRRVQNDNTIKHHGKKYQLLRKPGEQSYAGRMLEVQDWFDGSVHIVNRALEEFPFEEIATNPRYKRIDGLKKNTIISDIHRHTYF